jgi:formylglycine-generating enzyme required for sulfatase activity
MVRLPLGYCIDSTEVTRSQYQAWLDTNPSTTGQISVCEWNTTFVPTYDWPPTTALDHPVAFVDWCDAQAFCAGVGKQMCGTVGGGDGQPARGQWADACSSGGAYAYPYGDQYRPANCAGPESTTLTTVPVATMPLCQSSVAGYQGVFDLSGNVSEWQDYCESGTLGGVQHDRCVAAGGNFVYDITTDSGTRLRCEGGDWVERRVGSASIGIRCCSAN